MPDIKTELRQIVNELMAVAEKLALVTLDIPTSPVTASSPEAPLPPVADPFFTEDVIKLPKSNPIANNYLQNLLNEAAKEIDALGKQGANINGLLAQIAFLRGATTVEQLKDGATAAMGALEPLAEKYDLSGLAPALGRIIEAVGAGGGVLEGDTDVEGDMTQ